MSTTTIRRIDRYSIEVNGYRIRATPDQEMRLLSMSDEQIAMFLHSMGCESRTPGAEHEEGR